MPDRAPRPSLSLTARLAIGLVILLLIGGIILSLAALTYGRVAAREAFDRLLVGAANDIAASVIIADGAVVVSLPVSAFELLALAPNDRIAYQIRGADGQVLTGYDDLPVPDTVLSRSRDAVFFDGDFKGERARFIRVNRRFAERRFSGTVSVIVGQTLSARNELALDITRNALFVLAVGGVAILLLAVLLVRSALRPLDRLARSVEGRDPQDLTPLDLRRAPREIAVMGQAVNGFMRRLDHQFDSMRSLISDTAHQLRTPVAALRAQADFAAREPNLTKRDQLVGRIHARTISLGRLLDQMLSRALVVHRLDSARREVIDLRDIALEIVEDGDHHLIAPGADVRLQIGEAPVPVRGDAMSLKEAVKNLLGNALRHGRPPVVVGVDRSAGRARVWVQDTGPGPEAAVRAALGERFVLGAASRGQSAGIGLSIASAVAEALDGKLVLEDAAEGFRVSILIDVAEETT